MVTSAMKLRHVLLGRKVMTNLDSILKSRDITLSTKVHLVKALVSPVFRPGESHGQRSLVCCCQLGHKELDRTAAMKLKDAYSLEGKL